MQRKHGELVSVAETLADLPGPVQAIHSASPQARHHFTQADHDQGERAVCDRKPGGPGERQGGGVEPQPAAPLEVGRGVRAGAGEDPVPAAGEEQCEAGARETGSGSGLAPDRAAPAGGDESAAGAPGERLPWG